MESPHVERLQGALSDATPVEVIKAALTEFGDDVAISFSGAEDVLLLEYAAQTGLPFRVFSLDTGRLHPETLEYMATVERHYGVRIEYCVPDHRELEPFVRSKGLFSFFEDGHAECCAIRKVAPLRRHLRSLRAWITGVRRDQSEDTRSELATVESSPRFTGCDGLPILKFNPLAHTSREDVWAAITALEVPHNPLHNRGMLSIGCAPCTRPIHPGMHEREGRWWWETPEKKECGLHAPTTEDPPR
ncbi:MAG: phosphoadenylyl-sulfate reductase [Nannocystaceae bacterium]